jgi:hypothetical protein
MGYRIGVFFDAFALLKCLPEEIDNILLVEVFGNVEDVDVQLVWVFNSVCRP